MREGYKETELGEIPEDWNTVPLYELRNKADRYSFTGGPFGSDLKSEDYTSEGVRVIQLQNIGDGEFINKGFIYTSKEKADQLKSCNIYPNEIILAKMAPVARCCKIPEFTDRFVMCSDGIRLSVDREKYDSEFIFQALNSIYFKRIAESQSTGTTRARIGLSELKLIPIAIPKDKFEQQKIASILSTVDEKIEVIDEQINHTQELKKGLMQQLLTKGIGHTKFKDSELGEIPESWEVVRSIDIFDLIHGFQFRDTDFTIEGQPIIKIGQIKSNGKIDLSNCSYFSTDRTEEFKNIKIFNGDVLMALTGATLGKTCLVSGLKEPAFQNYRVGKFVPVDDKLLSKKFLYFLISSDIVLKQVFAKVNSGAQGNIGKSDFVNLRIPLPPFEEQQQISTILKIVNEKAETLQTKRHIYTELKKGLMQQLLTGRVRV